MRNRIDPTGEMPRFWPPKRSAFWMQVFRPLHRRVMQRMHCIDSIAIEGLDRIESLGGEDGVLICPNHSFTGDGSVIMELAMRCRSKPLHFMAAWHVFREHAGIDGWLLQRAGGFSVDREGCDRRAIRTAIDLLSAGRGLIVFPEGEIYHLNERLTPLREGVAFMAVSAQRDIDKSQGGGRVRLVPAAIRYELIGDAAPRLERAIARLESRLLLKPAPGMPLHDRLVRYGEMMLTIKEKEHLGRSFDEEGQTLPARLSRLMQHLLARHEVQCFNGKTRDDEPIPVRVKLLRQHLLDRLCDASPPAAHGAVTGEGGPAAVPDRVSTEEGASIRAALDDVHLVLQLFSYPGDYVSARPTPERMAETIEKFEEDTYGTAARPVGMRRARLVLGEPIDVKAQLQSGAKSRAAVGELTTRLEDSIRQLMRQAHAQSEAGTASP